MPPFPVPSLSTMPEMDEHKAKASHSPSLRHLNIWGYLALSFIILAVSFILMYALYSCYHSAKLENPHLVKIANDVKKPRKLSKKPHWTSPAPLSESQVRE